MTTQFQMVTTFPSSIRYINEYSLPFGELLDPILSRLAADTGLLRASEWFMHVCHAHAVDSRHTSFKFTGYSEGSVDVLGENPGHEAIFAIVAAIDDLILILIFESGNNRSYADVSSCFSLMPDRVSFKL